MNWLTHVIPSLEHDGVQRLEPGHRKCKCVFIHPSHLLWTIKTVFNRNAKGEKKLIFCRLIVPDARELTLDPHTANDMLLLSDDNTKVTVEETRLEYPDLPQRFSHWKQVLCKEGLSGRCYWEVDWEGWVNVGVAYKRIKRKGQDDDSWIGQNDASWSLACHDNFTACHKHQRIVVSMQPRFGPRRLAVYLDWHAGTLSFYRVSSDGLVFLHTFHSKFTEPLHPAFAIESPGSSVSLRHVCTWTSRGSGQEEEGSPGSTPVTDKRWMMLVGGEVDLQSSAEVLLSKVLNPPRSEDPGMYPAFTHIRLG